MKNLSEIKDGLIRGEYDGEIRKLCADDGRLEYNRNRYVKAVTRFSELFPDCAAGEIYSAPGRSEVCGNHTDHQNGMVLATSINLDAIAVVSPSDDGIIRLVSDDMPFISVDTSVLSRLKGETGTTAALIRGVCAGFAERGYRVGGFFAYVTSDVLMGAGLSSSAAFESLIGSVISGLYNDMSVSEVVIAQIGQYAENNFFGKPCGLMDQMACSVGGMIFIDFKDKENIAVEKVETDFEKEKISLCIVDTKGSHADLTEDYAAIPYEMKAVAEALGKESLRELDEETFYGNIPMLREKVSGRAVLRAVHFYEEEKRVTAAVKALSDSDYGEFMRIIKESGISSAGYLQNIYSPRDILAQNVTVALALTGAKLGKNGVCRVHGGGFAGTIQVFIKNSAVSEYKKFIEGVFGKDSCHVLKVRSYGGVRVV